MTISVGGSYNSWLEKKQYSVSVWDASEVFINALIETLEKRVERALKELLDNEEIIKISGGRYTSYTWNWKKEQ